MPRNRLKEFRAARNISMRELSGLSGVSTGVVHGIERYDCPSRPETKERLAKALDVAVEVLFSEGVAVERMEATEFFAIETGHGRQCERPKCRRWFEMTRRDQRHCSSNCASADRIRAWRARRRLIAAGVT